MAFVEVQGTTITVDDNLDAPQAIGQINGIGTIAGGERSERDRTTFASTAMEFGYGLKDNGVFTINCFYDTADAGQAELISLHDAASAVEREFVVTWSDAAVWTFQGIVTSATPTLDKDQDAMIDYGVRINGAIVKT